MSSWARPGVKCVCVKVLGGFHPLFSLKKGGIYTIRAIATSPSGDNSMALDGMKNKDGYGPFWHSSQFRPLITQSDDVALFKHHLVPVRELYTTPSD